MGVLAAALDRLTRELERVAAHSGEDAVHDVRVAVRRAAEALRLTGQDMPKARRLRRELRTVRRDAAAVRDRDVARRLLRRLGLPAADPALIYLAGQRDCAASQLRGDLSRLLQKDRPARWRKWSDHAREPVADLPVAIAKFFEAGREAAASGEPGELHQLRIAAKRLRYTIEILDPEGGEAPLAGLRALQRQLGAMQDAIAAESLLGQLPKLSSSARRVAGELQRRSRDYAGAASRAWPRRFGPRVEKAWLDWAAGEKS
ncbi:MAG TPA: CHAD domain-containing protein [Bryobacteraceae bacterium]|nr:CHAD domain-containing protein [Bryobacteraceae bacterium]